MSTRLVSLAIIAATISLLHGSDTTPMVQAVPGVLHREAFRLRAHFDSVDVELTTSPVGSLTPSQLQSRNTLLHWLREYRDNGVFPHNDRFAAAIPFFRDNDGVLCAMAYLIARSGRTDIVDRIARTKNNHFIAQLGDDPALGAWLDSVGLSAREAARIQPTYEFQRGENTSAAYLLGSIVTGIPTLVVASYNIVAPGRASGVMGLLTGTASMLLGAAKVTTNGGNRDLARANMLIGATGFVLGFRGLAHGRVSLVGSRESGTRVGPLRNVTLAPVVIPGGRVGPAGAGIGFRAGF